MTVKQLKAESEDLHCVDYISKHVAAGHSDIPDQFSVPHYPRPVQFRLSKLAHVTTKEGMDGILDRSGFTGGINDLLWWGLAIRPGERRWAERRYLNTVFPERTLHQRRNQEPFLHAFAKSPAFKRGSRYGNFRFALPLQEVLQAYSTQFCGGKEPILRVWETVVYKQEIMYSVLVHSPDVHDYDDCPELFSNEEGVCAYHNRKIIWRAQAISKTHQFGLIEDEFDRQCSVEDLEYDVFYVWDHVTLAFHIPQGNCLYFPQERLLDCLNACPNGETGLNELIGRKKAKAIVNERKAVAYSKVNGCFNGCN
ncbi:uncharacterized protein LOC134440947 isoform X2 [Engraulis encrasicolus]